MATRKPSTRKHRAEVGVSTEPGHDSAATYQVPMKLVLVEWLGMGSDMGGSFQWASLRDEGADKVFQKIYDRAISMAVPHVRLATATRAGKNQEDDASQRTAKVQNHPQCT